jgi:hypothetical protein
VSTLNKIRKRIGFATGVARRLDPHAIRGHIDNDSDLVVWLHHRLPDSWPKFFAVGDTFVKDAALISALVDAGQRFRIVTGSDIGHVANSKVVYSIAAYNPAGVVNYSASLMMTLRQLEAQGNTLFPSADEAEFWENKVFMHRRFAELGVNDPPTVIVERDTDLAAAIPNSFTWPVLVKEPHSYNGLGLHKIETFDELVALRERFAKQGSFDLLVQQIIDMRQDMRVTVIGGEIVHHYFRISHAQEWMPTTTRRGSTVDFDSFPEQWRGHIIETTRRLGLRSCAYDICWAGDDLSTEPIYLEVSPAYTPNPRPPANFDGPYADFKLKLQGNESFTESYVELLFSQHRLIVDAWGLGRNGAIEPAVVLPDASAKVNRKVGETLRGRSS